jgi:hypothetical protein
LNRGNLSNPIKTTVRTEVQSSYLDFRDIDIPGHFIQGSEE